jgi:hypothetical protein
VNNLPEVRAAFPGERIYAHFGFLVRKVR